MTQVSHAYRSVSSIDAITQALGKGFDPSDIRSGLLHRSVSWASRPCHHLPRLSEVHVDRDVEAAGATRVTDKTGHAIRCSSYIDGVYPGYRCLSLDTRRLRWMTAAHAEGH